MDELPGIVRRECPDNPDYRRWVLNSVYSLRNRASTKRETETKFVKTLVKHLGTEMFHKVSEVVRLVGGSEKAAKNVIEIIDKTETKDLDSIIKGLYPLIRLRWDAFYSMIELMKKYAGKGELKDLCDYMGGRDPKYNLTIEKTVEMFSDESVVNIFKMYDEDSKNEVMHRVEKFFKDFGVIPEYCKILNNDEIIQTIQLYKGELTEDLLSLYGLVESAPTIETAKTLQKYHNKDWKAVLELFKRAAMLNKIDLMGNLSKIFNKYTDNNDSLVNAINSNLFQFSQLDYEELASERAYRLINRSKKSEELIQKLLNDDFSSITSKILDEDVRSKMSYSDIKLMDTTHEFVASIHKGDFKTYKIEDGFYEEMNRAIEQGSNLKQKLANLRIYCKEVKQKLKENISELMYVG